VAGGYLFFLFCPHWVYLLGRPAIYWGNGDKWLWEISNHTTSRANSKQHPLQSVSVSLASQILANTNHIWYLSTSNLLSNVYWISAYLQSTNCNMQRHPNTYLLWMKRQSANVAYVAKINHTNDVMRVCAKFFFPQTLVKLTWPTGFRTAELAKCSCHERVICKLKSVLLNNIDLIRQWPLRGMWCQYNSQDKCLL